MMKHMSIVLLPKALCSYIANVGRIIRNDVGNSLSTVSGVQRKCSLTIAVAVVVVIQAGFILGCYLLSRNEK